MSDEENMIKEKVVRLCNIIEENVVELFNISDFLYSFFFGLLPSLMDITTDFSFADRFRYKVSVSVFTTFLY